MPTSPDAPCTSPPLPVDRIHRALAFALLALSWLHVLASPFAKVEESFNLQAVHDLLHFSLDVDKFDHRTFPGVVPRTFIGALILASVSWPVIRVVRFVLGVAAAVSALVSTEVVGLIPSEWRGVSLLVEEHARALLASPMLVEQVLVRCTLATFTVYTIVTLSSATRQLFGRQASRWHLLLTASTHFHIVYYAGRTLPNIFAFGCVNLALAHWLRMDCARPSIVAGHAIAMQSHTRALIRWLTFAMVVFRSELVLLFGPLLLVEVFIRRRMPLLFVIREGLVAALASLLLTIAVDSYFWQRWLWPEGEVLWFNTVLQQSHRWGVEPWYAYFTRHLPKLLGGAGPLLLGTMVVDAGVGGTGRRLVPYWLVSFVYVALYSALGHKEWRFVMYVVPLLDVVVSVGLALLFQSASVNDHDDDRRKLRTPWQTLRLALLRRIVVMLLLASVAASTFMLYVSSWNYAGGVALQRLHAIVPHVPGINDVPTAMTGASRFGEQHRHHGWYYSKDESISTLSADAMAARHTHLLTTTPERYKPAFEELEMVRGYDGVHVERNTRRWTPWRREVDAVAVGPLVIRLRPQVSIMRRTKQV